MPILGPLVLFWLVAQGASAQESSEQTEPEAQSEGRRAFQLGRDAFDAGRFEEALAHFRRSHEFSREPALLYNIGLVCERLRHDEEALVAFRGYLEAHPEAPNRTQIEARMEILERESEEPDDLSPSEEPEDVTPATEQARQEPRANPWPWIVGSSGVALSLFGSVMLGLSAADRNFVATGTRWSDVQSAYERVPTLSTLGVISLSLGVTLIGLSVALLVMRREPEQSLALTF